MAQGYNDRLDESLGMRRGKESGKKQSYKDRRNESRAMQTRNDSSGYKSMRSGGKTFDLKDNTQASEVKSINTNSEQYDLNRVKSYSCGSKGYPAEAWNYKY